MREKGRLFLTFLTWPQAGLVAPKELDCEICH